MSRKPRAKANPDEPLPLIEYGDRIAKLITETDSDPDYKRAKQIFAELLQEMN